jgi:hypothetical protein
MFWQEKRDEEGGFEKESFKKDSLKEAFSKIKIDIFTLGNEVSTLNQEVSSLKESLLSISKQLITLSSDFSELKNASIIPTHNPTDNLYNPTKSAIPSDNPTVPVEVRGLLYQNFNTSSGNRGVPTDRQTNQQTDEKEGYSTESLFQKPLKQHIEDASEIFDSLDAIKKEVRLKFKQITQQEMLVFSTIYQLEEQFPEGIEYKHLAIKLKLSESSIRDYVQKLIGKGIPVDKIKLNNKKILLKISPKLKTLASLQTLIKLREL